MTDADGTRTPPPVLQGRRETGGRLHGKRVLVVGGGQRTVDAATDPIGNGRSMSVLFAREGADLVIADRDPAAAQGTLDLIRHDGGTAHPVIADIGRPGDVDAMVAGAAQHLGGLDIVVLNVGIGTGALGLDGSTPESWDETFRINVRGPMLCARAALHLMSEGGAILLISSIAALSAGSRLPAYDASKAALGGLMRHIALEGASRGIRANVICPGLIDTPLGRLAGQGRASRGRTRIPLGRSGVAWDVAYAALYLVSDESAWVTGQILAVDGGLTGIA